jgi:hypothetical protein
MITLAVSATKKTLCANSIKNQIESPREKKKMDPEKE